MASRVGRVGEQRHSHGRLLAAAGALGRPTIAADRAATSSRASAPILDAVERSVVTELPFRAVPVSSALVVVSLTNASTPAAPARSAPDESRTARAREEWAHIETPTSIDIAEARQLASFRHLP
jgi:hypothetical protein